MKQGLITIIIAAIVAGAVIIIAGAGYYVYQNNLVTTTTTSFVATTNKTAVTTKTSNPTSQVATTAKIGQVATTTAVKVMPIVYENKEHGYRLEYPSTWTLTPKNAFQHANADLAIDSPMRVAYRNGKVAGDDAPSFFVLYYDSAKSLNKNQTGATNLANYLKDRENQMKKDGVVVEGSLYIPVKVGNYDGYKVKGMTDSNGETFYYLEHNGHIYVLQFEKTPEDAEPILNTFKFTN